MDPTPAGSERRVHHELRAVFDEAYARIEPLLDAAAGRNVDDASLLIQLVLRESYPQLSPSERYLFVFAARRVHAVRRQGARAGADCALAA
jgi:hypothetical protein